MCVIKCWWHMSLTFDLLYYFRLMHFIRDWHNLTTAYVLLIAIRWQWWTRTFDFESYIWGRRAEFWFLEHGLLSKCFYTQKHWMVPMCRAKMYSLFSRVYIELVFLSRPPERAWVTLNRQYWSQRRMPCYKLWTYYHRNAGLTVQTATVH